MRTFNSTFSKEPNDRGAVFVEFAAVIGLIVILLGGILNYGTLFGDNIDLAGASRSAALAGSATVVRGQESVAVHDYEIIRTLIDQTSEQRVGVKRVVIYKATGNAVNDPPGVCKAEITAVPTAFCNVYMADDLQKTDAEIEASPDSQGWPVSSRELGTDYLGVYIEVEKNPILDWIPSPKSYSDFFVTRLNSEASGTPEDVPSAGSWGNDYFTEPEIPEEADCWADVCGDPTPPCTDCSPDHEGGGG